MAGTKKVAAKKSSSGSTPKSKKIVRDKMETVMDEFKHHQLKSSSGEQVTNPKQAIAIGLSEARRSGADIPASLNQKKAVKKGPGKKAPAKKR